MQLRQNFRHYFRQIITSIHKTNIEQITKSLVKDKDVISTYISIVQNCSKTEGYKEIKHNLLHELIQLYLRVRAFLLPKYITDKLRLRNKSVKKKNFTYTNIYIYIQIYQ